MPERGKEKEIPAEWPEGWDGHRRAQRKRWMAATPAQRLAWLEEMIVLAWKTGALPRREETGGGEETRPRRRD